MYGLMIVTENASVLSLCFRMVIVSQKVAIGQKVLNVF